MTRRLLTALGLVTLVCVLAARTGADESKVGKVKKDGRPAVPDVKGDPKILVNDSATRQAQLKRAFESFRQRLTIMASRLENGNDKDKEKAKGLKKALLMANQMGTEAKFDLLIRELTKKNAEDSIDVLKQAMKDNAELRKDLQRLIAILSQDDSALNKEMMEKHAKLLERIKELIAKQERVRATTEMGRKTNKELEKDQNKVTKETREVVDGKKGGDKEGKGNESAKGEAKPEGKAGEEGRGKARSDTESKSEGKAAEGKEGKAGEARSSEGKEGKEGKASEGKGGDGKEGKPGEGKEGKGKDGEGRDGKGGDSKEGKAGEGKEGKGEGKAGEGKGGDGKEGKGGEGKEGKPGEGKGGEGKGGEGKAGEGKEGKGGEGKPGENKAGSGKPGEGKEGKPGAGKPGEGKPGAGKPGAGKPGEGKPGEGKPSESKGSGEGKGEGKPGKPGDAKGGQPGEGKGGGSGKPGSGKPGKGGGSPPPGGQQDDQPDDNPVKKQIEDANKYQKQAEIDLDKQKKPDAAESMTKAIKELEAAKKKLEDLLKQMREEEIERLLADLEKRCRYMLAVQIEIRDGTVVLDKEVQKNVEKKMTLPQSARSNKLADDEDKLVREADQALKLIRTEGSAVAFAEVFEQVRKDMDNVRVRLSRQFVDEDTQRVENDIIETLTEMIAALQKAQKEAKQGKPGKGGGGPQDQKLIDQIAELKMIYAMQKRVNGRTETYGKKYTGEQAPTPEAAQTPREREHLELIQKELKDLSGRQQKIGKVTRDIATGKNENK